MLCIALSRVLSQHRVQLLLELFDAAEQFSGHLLAVRAAASFRGVAHDAIGHVVVAVVAIVFDEVPYDNIVKHFVLFDEHRDYFVKWLVAGRVQMKMGRTGLWAS